jgi:uncharacterized protein
MAGGLSSDAPHLPRAVPIDAYGKGGFRFAGMSHLGSLLCLPDGIWAWPIASTAEMTPELLEPIFARAKLLDFVVLGGGRDPCVLPGHLRARFRELGLSVDTMATGVAVSTYNILLGEKRRVGAGLIAAP